MRARRAQELGDRLCEDHREEGSSAPAETREFAATTQGLLLLWDWLVSFEVELVGMEATGVYWKPIYYMLEDDDFE